MNLLALIPEKFRVWVEVVVNAIPILKCSMEGHEAGVAVQGSPTHLAVCKRCGLVYEFKR